MSEETPFDHERWKYELNRDYAHRFHDLSNEFFHKSNAAAIESATFALKTLILINGGAIISLLTFIGSNPDKHKDISAAIVWLIGGLISAMVSISLAYVTHYCTAGSEGFKEKTYDPKEYLKATPASKRAAHLKIIFHLAAILFAGLSLTLFSAGVLCASRALTAEPTIKAPISIIRMYIGPVRLELTH